MIAKDSIDAARENVRSMEIAEARKEYVKAHTDSELEERLMHDVENPEKYEELWERIESFKRDNPVFCSKHASRYERFGWNNVGHERLKPFFRLSGYTGDKGDPIVVRPVNDIAPVGF